MPTRRERPRSKPSNGNSRGSKANVSVSTSAAVLRRAAYLDALDEIDRTRDTSRFATAAVQLPRSSGTPHHDGRSHRESLPEKRRLLRTPIARARNVLPPPGVRHVSRGRRAARPDERAMAREFSIPSRPPAVAATVYRSSAANVAEPGNHPLTVVCPAFVADNLETLEEIGITGREHFLQAGGESLTLVPCLNDDPAWVETVAGWCNDAETPRRVRMRVEIDTGVLRRRDRRRHVRRGQNSAAFRSQTARVGALRFRRPAPAPDGPAMRVGDRVPRPAPQQDKTVGVGLARRGRQRHEDCLYLNVFAPAARGTAAAGVRLDLRRRFICTATAPIRCSTDRISRVRRTWSSSRSTIDWACGVLRRSSSATSASRIRSPRSSGWRATSPQFGGDPGNVTRRRRIGRRDERLQPARRASARGLFHRAIAQSGAADHVATRAQADETAAVAREELGIDPDDADPDRAPGRAARDDSAPAAAASRKSDTARTSTATCCR